MKDNERDLLDRLLAEQQRDPLNYRLPKISSRDHALFLVEERDLKAQLIAIRGALWRNKAAEEAASENIKEMETHIRGYAGGDAYQIHIEGQWVDAMHDTVFRDAAHSMAAVGMLAPFLESLFVAIFSGLRDRQVNGGADDPRAKAAQDQYWNPQVAFRKDGTTVDIILGIKQLATSTRLQPYLPSDYEKVLTALFSYRNNMFHNGLEWPVDIREKFSSRIEREGWGEWFSKAESGGRPWIFYMSDTFIQQCLTTIDATLNGVGEFLARGDD